MGGCLGEASQHRIQRKFEIEGKKMKREKIIANGAYGDIWKCSAENHDVFALKQIKLFSKELKEMFQKQVQILVIFFCYSETQLKGTEGIIQIIGSVTIRQKENDYDTGYILLEWCQMSLFDQLKISQYEQKEVANVLLTIVRAVKQIHAKGFIHLDLKPENVLLQKNSYKICDFGSSLLKTIDIKSLQKKQVFQLIEYVEGNSTLIYRSPQLIHMNGIINEKADIWTIGCIGYLLLYRKHPFEKDGKLGIVTGQVQYERQYKLNECFRGMLNPKLDERWSADKVEEFLQQILI